MTYYDVAPLPAPRPRPAVGVEEFDLPCDAPGCERAAGFTIRLVHTTDGSTCCAHLGCKEHVREQLHEAALARALSRPRLPLCTWHQVGAVYSVRPL